VNKNSSKTRKTTSPMLKHAQQKNTSPKKFAIQDSKATPARDQQFWESAGASKITKTGKNKHSKINPSANEKLESIDQMIAVPTKPSIRVSTLWSK
jgi:hypothetical protein